MDYLKKLVLKNFLCYEKAVFKFHPGVNMIIGPTDHGKSAIMGALKKLITNRPLGDEFQSWWNKNTKISLTLDDFIIRYIKNKQASYQIKNKKSGKIISLKAVGQSIPQEISDILKIDTKINIQKQLEKKSPIFLLSESPGDVAKFTNDVANLGIIDSTLLNGKTDLNSNLTEKKNIDKQIKAKQKELDNFWYLPDLKIKISFAEKLEQKIESDSKKIQSIENSLSKIEKNNQKMVNLDKKLTIMPKVKKLLSEFQNLDKVIELFDSLSFILDDIENNEKRLKIINKKIKSEPLVKRANVLIKIISQYQKDIEFINTKNKKIKSIKNQIDELKIKIDKKRREFKKKFPDICPWCNSKVNRSLL